MRRMIVSLVLTALFDGTQSNADERASNGRVEEGDTVYITVDLMRAPEAGSDCWSWVSRCDAVRVVLANPEMRRWAVMANGVSYELEGDWDRLFHRTQDECFAIALKSRQPEVRRENDSLHLESDIGLESHQGEYQQQETACGWFIAPPFAGWVVHRPMTGMQIPLTDVKFSKGSGWIVFREIAGPQPPELQAWLEPEKRCSPPQSFEPMRVTVDAEGYFSTSLGISTSTTTWRNETTRRWETYNEDPVVVLHAAGCEDLTIHFTHRWEEQILVMTCPGRTPAQ